MGKKRPLSASCETVKSKLQKSPTGEEQMATVFFKGGLIFGDYFNGRLIAKPQFTYLVHFPCCLNKYSAKHVFFGERQNNVMYSKYLKRRPGPDILLKTQAERQSTAQTPDKRSIKESKYCKVGNHCSLCQPLFVIFTTMSRTCSSTKTFLRIHIQRAGEREQAGGEGLKGLQRSGSRRGIAGPNYNSVLRRWGR